MIQFEDYISADNIIDILCRLRAKLADQRHKKQLLQHLAIYKETKKTGQDRLSAINSILPPRSKWFSLKEKTRTREFITHDNRKYKQPISSFAKNKKSITPYPTTNKIIKNKNNDNYNKNVHHQ